MPAKRKHPVIDPKELKQHMSERAEAQLAKESVALGFICTSCGAKHDNYHSDVAHGLCTKCRDDAFERSRANSICCRCGSGMAPLTPHNAEGMDQKRFLACAKCGLVISATKGDTVRGSQHVRSP